MTQDDALIPQIGFWHLLRHRLPPLYLAHVIGNAVASGIALNLRGLMLLPVFSTISIVLSSLLYVIFRRLSPKQPTVSPRDFKEWRIAGVALWGVPMAMFFGCYAVLPSLSESMASHAVQRGIVAIMLGLAGVSGILIGLLGGLGYGALMYYFARRVGASPRGPAAT
jgi:hypothetical protein